MREILHHQFGKTSGHIVAQAHINQLAKGQPVKSGDGATLQKLARQMLKCELTLTQMGCEADLNNSETLLGIMDRLPMYLQTKWTERAEAIFKSGGRPRFSDLAAFVQQRADAANNTFGQHLSETKPREKSCQRFSQPRKQNEAPRRGTTLAVRSQGHEDFSRSPHKTPRGSRHESPRQGPRESPRGGPRESQRESPRKRPRESPRESSRGGLRESPRKSPCEGSRERPREGPREGTRGSPRESSSDQRESARGDQRDNLRTYPPPDIHNLSSECPLCSRLHALSSCETFKRKSYQERLELMFQKHISKNCIIPGHYGKGCAARRACERPGCQRKHHTLLHPPADTNGDQEEHSQPVSH